MRRPAVLCGLGSLAVLLVLLVDVLAHGPLSAADGPLHDDALRLREPALTTAARALTTAGSSPVLYAAFLVTAVALALRRRGREALLAAALLLTGQLVRRLLNGAVGRPRPPRADWLVGVDGHAWPSGHASSAVLGLGLLAVLLRPALGSTGRRVLAGLAALLAVAIGLSRVYLGVHWPTDVLGGWAFGAAWLSASVPLLLVVRRRISGSPPAARPASPR